MADRRNALKLALYGACAPLFAMRAAPALAKSAPAGLFRPPMSPLCYTRALHRELGRGAHIEVSRAFSVRFSSEAAGFRLDGSQISAEVDMPPSLESLARIERERREDGIFPMQLDNAGAIIGGPDYRADEAIGRAIGVVEQKLATGNFDGADQQVISGMLQAAHRQSESLVATLPVDLFAPRQRATHDSRSVNLPGGSTGRIEVSFEAQVDPETGVLQSAQRRIVTRIGDSARATVESWSLAPLSA
ncbi:hypothetical protein [Paraurantiacibacter namhicola]|uniref:Uncharacterized protein n=1 Tax=Paraurantiacibacter namhicola TaxID=645517 RepID=A0A1C7D647_9SPHN|nr:hypothetical protein [Paraurantiacibacter namhicola]ANU06783.1 hypothetical protein A6F65_00458 [Paraurantiacibacter namhicola]